MMIVNIKKDEEFNHEFFNYAMLSLVAFIDAAKLPARNVIDARDGPRFCLA